MTKKDHPNTYSALFYLAATRPISVTVSLIFLWVIWVLIFIVAPDVGNLNCDNSIRSQGIACAAIGGGSVWGFFILWLTSIGAAVKMIDGAKKRRWLGILSVAATAIMPPFGLLMAGLLAKFNASQNESVPA